MATVFGIAGQHRRRLRGRADSTTSWTCIQLVFGFVNAPLFATFLLGMFWKRTTGHGAFFGLLAGTLASALHTAVTGPDRPLARASSRCTSTAATWPRTSGWPSTPGPPASWSRSSISLRRARKKSDEELRGLVYSLTPRFAGDDHLAWYAEAGYLAVLMVAVTIALNIIFW